MAKKKETTTHLVRYNGPNGVHIPSIHDMSFVTRRATWAVESSSSSSSSEGYSSSSSSSGGYSSSSSSSEQYSSSSSSSEQYSSSSSSSSSEQYSSSSSSSSSEDYSSSSSSTPGVVPDSSSSSSGLDVCNPDDAGDPNAPRLRVTLTWSGGPSTQTYMGCAWSNGESKLLMPSTYGGTTTNGEYFRASTAYNDKISLNANGTGSYSVNPVIGRYVGVGTGHFGIASFGYLNSGTIKFGSTALLGTLLSNLIYSFDNKNFSDATAEWGAPTNRATNVNQQGLGPSWHSGFVTITASPNVTITWTLEPGSGAQEWRYQTL